MIICGIQCGHFQSFKSTIVLYFNGLKKIHRSFNGCVTATHLLVAPKDLRSEGSLLAHIERAPVYELLGLLTAHHEILQ